MTTRTTDHTSTRLTGARHLLMLWVLPLGSIVLVIVLALCALLQIDPPEHQHHTTPSQHAAHSGHAHHSGASTHSHNDYFTNFGHYMQRTGCLATATGEPDWPWIITLIILNVGIILAYLRIYVFWTRAYLAEEQRDRNGKLMDLAQVFLWCAICGYAAGIVMFFWPAYRLVAICLLILNIWSWRFVININSFRVAFSAGRYRRLASMDTLTGLPNRMSVRDQIEDMLNSYRAGKGNPFAVLFLDFDRFKLINDTLGHDVGDELLKAIAGRLDRMLSCESGVEQVDGTAARLGGDEFVIVLNNIREEKHAVRIARYTVEQFTEPFDLDGRKVRSGPSIGVVVVNTGYTQAEQMLRDADVAMYAAKRDEQSNIAVFDKAMLAEVAERMDLENDLHHAVDRGELYLHYQPLVNLDTGLVDGFEALVRWRHPQRGLIQPDMFICIAEETGIINQVGRWVFENACRQLADWNKTGVGRGWRMHVNVSTNQVYDPRLPERFTELARACGVTPENIVLEVTESTFTSNVESTAQTLGALRGTGFTLAMDDFGTGYSSLSMLHRFPINELKIDRSFIVNMSDQPDYAAVIHAIVSLAENLRIEVVGEGIETPEQLAELQALGCNLAQGYYFSKPLPPEQAFAWAEAWGNRRASA